MLERAGQMKKKDRGGAAFWPVFFVVFAFAACLQPVLLGQAVPSSAKLESAFAIVPFVGCKADGQAGPLAAPQGTSKTVRIPAEMASHLAYYEAEQGLGVLAPRAWYCFETYGSNGGALYVSPSPIKPEDLFSDKWSGFAGPAVELADDVGDTSGRFEVAAIIARVFPAYKAFVDKVIAEDIEPATDFPFGPYPQDKLTYKSKEVVEYETPAEAEGLGTASRLGKSADPIRGVAILRGETPDLVLLSVRLSVEQARLAPAIIQQVENEPED